MEKQDDRWHVELATGSKMVMDSFVHSCVLDLGVCTTSVDRCVFSLESYVVVLGVDCLKTHQAKIIFCGKRVQCLYDSDQNVEIVGV